MITIKVLVCGSYKGAFQLKLCQRLKKEKQEVFVLSNDPVTEKKPFSVFQDYRFSFDSESVMNVMTSVSPDAVIMCGALDESYDWRAVSGSVEYVAGIMNLMNCALAAKVKTCIYISSLDVFDGNMERNISETEVPVPSDQRGKSILQGEKICLSSTAGETSAKISVIRMPQVYGICEKRIESNVCREIVEAVSEGKKVELNRGETCHLMYLNDGVEAVYKILMGEQKELRQVYHIVPESAVDPESVQDYLESLIKEEGTNSLKDREEKPRFVSTTQEEIGFKEKYTLEAGLQIFLTQYQDLPRQKERESLQENVGAENQRKMFRPILETMAAFVLVHLFVIATKGAVFHRVVDVYLIYSMIVAVVFGTVPSVVAIILSILGKWQVLFLADHNMSVFTDYTNYLWMLQLFLLVVLVGCLKDWYTGYLGEMKRENNYLKEETESLKSINDSNVEVKEVFEERLVNYRDSYAKVYEIISQLDDLEAKSILFKAARVVADVMNSDDVAIYVYDETSGYCRLMAATSKSAGQRGKSLQQQEYQEVFEQIHNRKIFMNRKFEENLPIFAAGTYNGEHLEAVIMVWSMKLENISLHQSNLLSMLTKLMERSTTKALRYMDSVKYATYISGTNVMEPKAFGNMLDIYCASETEGVLEYTLLEIIVNGKKTRSLYKTLEGLIRGTDYLGEDDNGKIYALLTNSNQSESVFVMRRWEESGIQTRIVEKKQGKTVEEVFSSIAFLREDVRKEKIA